MFESRDGSLVHLLERKAETSVRMEPTCDVQRRREEARGDGEGEGGEEDGSERVRKTAARKEGAEKRKKVPSVRDGVCLPISAASRK
jgi:hypothetical protein